VYRTGIREEDQPTTNVAVRSNLRDDLYVVPAAYFPEKAQVHVKAFVNPMVIWIWLGGVFVLFGCALALLPQQRVPLVLPPPARQAAAKTADVAAAQPVAVS
jgi:cytochrome c-type biogenesis protein CcmF